MTVGEEYGRLDVRERGYRRWWLLQLAGCDDRDLSDYWEGRHRAWRPRRDRKAQEEPAENDPTPN